LSSLIRKEPVSYHLKIAVQTLLIKSTALRKSLV
jgi:hypothetical protein